MALGEVVIAAGQLEYIIDMSIHGSAHASIYEGLKKAQEFRGPKDKLDYLKKQHIAPKFEAGTVAEFDDAAGQIVDAMERRNKAIHALYAIDENGNQVRNFRSSTGKQPYSRKELRVRASAFRNLRDDLRYWRYRLDILTRELFLSRKGK